MVEPPEEGAPAVCGSLWLRKAGKTPRSVEAPPGRASRLGEQQRRRCRGRAEEEEAGGQLSCSGACSALLGSVSRCPLLMLWRRETSSPALFPPTPP